MLDLFVASELARRRTAASWQPKQPRKPKGERPRRRAVRTASATALRRLADRLEPSPSA
jgi:hypothetical protein